MQQLAEQDPQADRVDVRSARRRKTSARRKVTVRLSERVCSRLDRATDRPGVGKSMLIEAALESFWNPAPSVETLLREGFDNMNARLGRLDHDVRMIGETVALHARYHLAVMPPIPQSRQRDAVILGGERFKILAEQVDRRVRENRPLMQETIDRPNAAVQHDQPDLGKGERSTQNIEPAPENSRGTLDGVELKEGPPASADTLGRNAPVVRLPKISAAGTKPASIDGSNPRTAHDSDRASSSEKMETVRETPLSKLRLVLSVFLPFASGYYLAYLFRTINAAISPALVTEFGLDAAEIGLLASIYFLVFGLTQLPIGVFLDRFGPRRVQGALLVIAAGGATLFGTASSYPELLVARAMIGLGVAGSLMAGLKSIVTWFPSERVALANGWMIMLGSLGAVTATTPAEWSMDYFGWRGLFEVLTIGTIAVSGLIYFIVPERRSDAVSITKARNTLTLRSIYLDRRFLRIAPLSAACIGSSWSMQALWAAAWLTDVEGYDHQGRADQMFLMAVGLSLGALLLGIAADRLRKRGVKTEVLLGGVGALFVAAELVLVLRVPVSPLLPWSMVSIAGAATVLSFAAIAEYFPKDFSARANGALNLLHFAWAFVVQFGIGLIVNQWEPQDAHYPVVAYQAAFGLNLAFQTAALVWFGLPWLERFLGYLRPLLALRYSSLDCHVATMQAPSGEVVMEASQGAEW